MLLSVTVGAFIMVAGLFGDMFMGGMGWPGLLRGRIPERHPLGRAELS